MDWKQILTNIAVIGFVYCISYIFGYIGSFKWARKKMKGEKNEKEKK